MKFAALLVFLVAVGCTEIVAGEEHVLRGTPSCDCKYVSGIPEGCMITRAAPTGYSCQCILSGSSCSGILNPCSSSDSLCKNPDTSIQSCFYNGNGNCYGYSAPSGCSCKYRSHGFFSGGGCYIASAAPAFYLCHCDYALAWTCSGRTIVNNNNCQGWPRLSPAGTDLCLRPGTSKADCQKAAAGIIKPDCDGY